MSGIEELLGLSAIAEGAAGAGAMGAGAAGAGAGAAAGGAGAAGSLASMLGPQIDTSAFMMGAGPSLANGGYNFADSALGGVGDLEGLSMGAPGGGGGAGKLLKALGLDTPQAMTSALGSGVDLAMKNRQLQIASQNANRAYAVAPGIHSGNATPVKVGMPLARKQSPLEEFALLMRGRS